MEKESSIRYSQKHSRDMEKEGKILSMLAELKETTGKNWTFKVDDKGVITFKFPTLSPTPPDCV